MTEVTPRGLVGCGEERAALAPVPGAANETDALDSGLLNASSTVTCKGVANCVLIGLVCGVPPLAVMEAGGPAVLVSENVAGVVTPVTLAVTV